MADFFGALGAIGKGLQPLAQYDTQRRDNDLALQLLAKDPARYQAYTGAMNDRNRGGESPSSVREYQYWNSLSPAEKEEYLRVKRAQQVVNLGGTQAVLNPTGGIQEQYTVTPKISETPEFQAAQEAAKTTAQLEAETAGRPDLIEATKGAENLAELKANQPKALSKVEAVKRQANNILDTIAQARTYVAAPATEGYIGQKTQDTGGTPAFNLKKQLGTIKGNLGFAELQAMRDASPTGGALGQVAVQELEALQSTIASLDLGQTDEQLIKNLDKIENHILNWQNAVQKSYDQTYGAANQTADLVTGTRLPNPGTVVDVVSQEEAYKYAPGTKVRLNGQVFVVED